MKKLRKPTMHEVADIVAEVGFWISLGLLIAGLKGCVM